MNKNSLKKKGYRKIKTSKLSTLYVIPKETSSCQEGSDLKGEDLLLQIPLRYSEERWKFSGGGDVFTQQSTVL